MGGRNVPVTGGARVAAEKASRAKALRHTPTPSEALCWSLLRNRRLLGLKFRRQQPIGGFIVDFVCVELNLVIEVDGDVHAVTAEADAERTAALQARGFRVIRVANESVSAEHLTAAIRPLLATRSTT